MDMSWRIVYLNVKFPEYAMIVLMLNIKRLKKQ